LERPNAPWRSSPLPARVLEADDDATEFIRKIAYAIREKEGRPDGKELDLWLHAEAVVRGAPAHDGIADLFGAGRGRPKREPFPLAPYFNDILESYERKVQ